uniref:Uncharacterized protein n=1 Tax=Arcella intermedia TaxID=1963864 RepID=A0A6B2LSH3_9EUKA
MMSPRTRTTTARSSRIIALRGRTSRPRWRRSQLSSCMSLASGSICRWRRRGMWSIGRVYSSRGIPLWALWRRPR